MKISNEDLRFEYMRGQGAGGQHKNKTSSCVRVTHLPTGIQVTIDGRHQGRNKKKALRVLEDRLRDQKEEKKAEKKKSRRDRVIHERKIIRTYDYSRGLVTDHRTKKTATIKQIMEKGRLDLIQPDENYGRCKLPDTSTYGEGEKLH